MIRIKDKLGGEQIEFCCPENTTDLREVKWFIQDHKWLAYDTESTGLNCYRPEWQLKTAQWGHATLSYMIPARYRQFIGWAFRRPLNLIGHNIPYDIRCTDRHLGYETGVRGVGETHIPFHHVDSRGREDGGTGHKLKELAIAHLDPQAGKWEVNLKAAFKEIHVPMPGVYKSGPKKGQQKTRKIRYDEGWSLISIYHPAYIAYAASDPVLTYRLWSLAQPVVANYRDLYKFDRLIGEYCSVLNRRAMLIDVDYTERLSAAYKRKATQMRDRARIEFECANVNSPLQVGDKLIQLDVKLKAKTNSGQWKVNAEILRALVRDPSVSTQAKKFINYVLLAKQLDKRRSSYTEAFLTERDENDRVHPAINPLAARTARMSVSNPPLQQLPTKDHQDELMWEGEE